MDKIIYCVLNRKDYLNAYVQSNPENSPLADGVPLLDISDKDIMEIYYYRWYTYFEHIKKTDGGYVITEFLNDVPWAGKCNTINCALGHHLYEGRWIYNKDILNDYCKWWFRGGEPRLYSTWIADAVLAYAKVSGDRKIISELYNDLKENYFAWEKEKKRANGLFYQLDGYDGMEYSISGAGFRPTLNSYMYGDLRALKQMAKMLSLAEDAAVFKRRAEELKSRVNSLLWDKNSSFYKTLAENKSFQQADVLELCGYIPWYFNLADKSMADAWRYLNDADCFYGKFGPTTAQRSHPGFMKKFDHECLWNGPSWPYATSQTLTAMENLLNNYSQEVVKKRDYFELLKPYARSQHIKTSGGNIVPFIDEDLHPDTGEWIARKILHEKYPESPYKNRGEKYNHSTFCDLVISGLVGIRADFGERLVINPLFEENQIDYMAADGILYHSKSIAVVWDKTGEKFGKGKGLRVFIDGCESAHSAVPDKIIIDSERS